MELETFPCFGCGEDVIFEVYTDTVTGNKALNGTCYECPAAITASEGSVRNNPMQLILTREEE